MNFSQKESIESDLNDILDIIERVQKQKYDKLVAEKQISEDRKRKGPAFISGENIAAECQAISKDIGKGTTLYKLINIVRMPRECRTIIASDSEQNLFCITKDIAMMCTDRTPDEQVFLFKQLMAFPLEDSKPIRTKRFTQLLPSLLQRFSNIQVAQHCFADISVRLAKAIAHGADRDAFNPIFEQVFTSGNIPCWRIFPSSLTNHRHFSLVLKVASTILALPKCGT
jgi:hypothetical protein